MARRRKPTDLAPYSLRVRHELRQRIAKAAKKNQTSENNEMRIRLERSFEADDLRTLSMITHDISIASARLGELARDVNRMVDLLRAVERLTAAIEQLPADVRADENMRNVVEQVESVKAITKLIDIERAIAARQAHTAGS